jgi:hypothetical protein
MSDSRLFIPSEKQKTATILPFSTDLLVESVTGFYPEERNPLTDNWIAAIDNYCLELAELNSKFQLLTHRNNSSHSISPLPTLENERTSSVNQDLINANLQGYQKVLDNNIKIYYASLVLAHGAMIKTHEKLSKDEKLSYAPEQNAITTQIETSQILANRIKYIVSEALKNFESPAVYEQLHQSVNQALKIVAKVIRDLKTNQALWRENQNKVMPIVARSSYGFPHV